MKKVFKSADEFEANLLNDVNKFHMSQNNEQSQRQSPQQTQQPQHPQTHTQQHQS